MLLSLLPLTSAVPALAGGALLQSLPEDGAPFVPPAVLVGFNPQPEPPALALDASIPPEPVITLDGFERGQVDLLLGLAGDIASIVLPASACGTRTDTVVWPTTTEVPFPGQCAAGTFTLRVTSTDGQQADLDVSIVGHGNVPPGTLVGFNPQPEPPAVGAAIGLAVDFGTARVHTAEVRVALHDATGAAVDLQ